METLTDDQPGGGITKVSQGRDIHELLNNKLPKGVLSTQSEEQRLHSYPSKYSIGYGSQGSTENFNMSVRTKGEGAATIKINDHKPEEEDFEEPAMPTDDEGITNFSQTQKIPISLIKKQDKASVSL